MKKIGILFGQENTFPWAFIERVNEKKIPGVIAEAVSINKVMQGEATEYAVIIDRISQDVPFYRAYLKNAAISGTAVINNPFWWSADEKFFNNALAVKIGVPVPNTVILPSKTMPDDTSANSFRNLKYPLDWEAIFKYVGFPAYMKPHAGGGWKSVYKIHNMEDFFDKYSETGQLVMMLQSEVIFEEYFRCYCLGGKYVHIMPYEPRNPHHLRYAVDTKSSPELLAKVEEYVLKLNHALGYDFNTVEFGVVDGVPYAIDFCNPAPDADIHSVGQKNFDWIVENAANFAIEKALAHKEGQDNLTWGTFIKSAVGVGSMIPDVKKGTTSKITTRTTINVAPVVTKSTTTTTTTTTQTPPVLSKSTITTTTTKAATTAKKSDNSEGVTTKVAKVAKTAPPTKAAKTVKKADKVTKKEAPTKAVKTVKKASNTEGVTTKVTKVVKVAAPAKSAAPVKKVAVKEAISVKDDLKKVEGVGAKIEELLNNAGISTFVALSKTATDKIKAILDGGGKRYQMHDPSTWSKQAKMAADGQWDALKTLQDELKGGK
jgi:predicted flap endonuclease-1-like 5' DNA nuclease